MDPHQVTGSQRLHLVVIRQKLQFEPETARLRKFPDLKDGELQRPNDLRFAVIRESMDRPDRLGHGK
jgi:hypothetical protein